MKKRVKKKHKLYLLLLVILGISIFIGTLTYKVNELSSNGYLTEPLNEDVAFLTKETYSPINNESIYKKQEIIKNNILSEYQKGNYTFDNPYIITEPFPNTTNTALIMFDTPQKETVKVTIKGINNDDITYNLKETKKHYISLIGLYQNYNNKVILQLSNGQTKELFIKLKGENKNEQLNEEETFNYVLSDKLRLYDSSGNVRHEYNYKIDFFKEYNNHFIFVINDLDENYLLEIDELGYIIKRIDFKEKIDDLIIINDIFLINQGSKIIYYNYNEDSIIKEIDIKNIILDIDHNFNKEVKLTNLTYDLINNRLIMVINDSIVAFNYDSLNIEYIFGMKNNWSYLFNKYILNVPYISFNKINNLSVADNYITFTGSNIVHNECIINKNNYLLSYEIDINRKIAKEVNRIDLKEYNNIYYDKVYAANSSCDNEYTLLDNNLKSLFKIRDVKQIENYDFSLNNYCFKEYEYKNNYNYPISLSGEEIKKLKNYNILNLSLEYIDDKLYIKSNNEIDYIILLSSRGYAYRYKVDNKMIYINNIKKGRYYIFVDNNGIYNTNNYLDVI